MWSRIVSWLLDAGLVGVGVGLGVTGSWLAAKHGWIESPCTRHHIARPLPRPPRWPDRHVGPVVGVTGSDVYHRPDCPSALRIGHAARRRETWPDAAAAETAGRRPCRVCRPG